MKNIIFFFIFVLFSCTEGFEFEFENTESKLVIDGEITNRQGPDRVVLTLSKTSFENASTDTINNTIHVEPFEYVKDALVVISDNVGNIDTLTEKKLPNYSWHGMFARGYETNFIKGVPGRTYYLYIKWRGKEYKSTCYMPLLTKIDTIIYEAKKGAVGKDDFYIPYIWFKDNPHEKNYYLFKFDYPADWRYSILSDEYLKPNIKGINVFKGENADQTRPPFYAFSDGTNYRVFMYSITREIYEFYNALIEQFKTDGGVYGPSPAAPVGNISNGALGIFVASAVDSVVTHVPTK